MLNTPKAHVHAGESMSKTSIEQIVSMETERFGAYLRAEKRTDATVISYSRSLGRFLTFVKKPVEEITKADMQSWKGHLAERYCENTMSAMIASVNCYTANILERPDLKMRSPRQVEKQKIPLTENEVRAIMDEARKPRQGENGVRTGFETSYRDYAQICVMYYGGLRVSEIVKLKVSGLNLDKQRLQVYAGKGKDYSSVNLTDEAVQAIRVYITKGRPTPTKGHEDTLFLSAGGLPLSRKNVWTMVKRMAFEAGIEKNVHPHIFRHSMITHMAEKGLSASFIQAQSRHKSLDDVQKYTHLSERSQRNAYDTAFDGNGTGPAMPRPSTPGPKPAPGPMYADGGDLREKVLAKYLDGEIDDTKLEKMLSLIDRQPVMPKVSPVAGYQ
jgi:integrase/recombinase XerD